MARIFLLSKLIKTLANVCKVIDVSRTLIQPFVPPATLTDWNAALDRIKAACDVVRLTEYADSVAGTTAPWGVR